MKEKKRLFMKGVVVLIVCICKQFVTFQGS